MSPTRTSRPIPIALTALVAFFSALAALAVSSGHAHAHGNAPHEAHATIGRTELVLRRDMRQLWEDHIVWTRLAIISLITDAPDTEATVDRLLSNQTDIGSAVKPFYGKAAGDKLIAELRQHILIAADVVAAAKAGDQAKLADAQSRWQRNADTIASVLNSVNPRFWKLAAMKAEMRMHLNLTTQEAVARLSGNWAADVTAYDRIHRHILHMSDLLSAGLVKQFPKRFR
jgi:phage terminase Nu1 subunit (DNA packaging protein)